MSVATESKTVAAAAPVMDEAAQIAAIRGRWATADRNEAQTLSIFEGAKLAWENARVIKSRVAYAAAMVKPEKGGVNRLNAARILFSTPEDSAATATKKARAKKSTVELYITAGIELDAAQLAYSDAEPTPEERAIVNRVFTDAAKAKAKAEKEAARAAKGKGKGEGEGEGEGEAPAKGAKSGDDPITQQDVVAAVETLKSVVERFTRDHGFAAVVADNLTDVLGEISALMEAHKVDGGK